MSNPDEETAINQFGKGDKYFGVATMLITLPGLPMFAHGQVEGLSEKYGMEYKRAYYDEFTDDNLIARHEKALFPLTMKRYLFSQVDNFELYDFIDPHGICNENVFAFTNRSGNEVSLVIYNNSYSEAYSTINYSSERAYVEEGRTTTTSIDKALRINSGNGFYYIYKDYVQQLEFIISGSEISSAGFSLHLMGYQRKVLLDFKEVFDFDGRYRSLYEQLNGSGVDSIERALSEMNLAPFHNSLVHLFTSIKFSRLLLALDITSEDKVEIPQFDEEISRICTNLNKIKKFNLSTEDVLEKIATDIAMIDDFNKSFLEIASSQRPVKWIGEFKTILYNENDTSRKKELSFLLINYILFRILKSVENGKSDSRIFDELLLWKPLIEIFGHLRYDDPGKSYELSKVLFVSDFLFIEKNEAIVTELKSETKSNGKRFSNSPDGINKYLLELLDDELIRYFIQVNEHNGIKYFNKERIEEFVKWKFIVSAINGVSQNSIKGKISKKSFLDALKITQKRYADVMERISKSEYKIENLIALPAVMIIEKVKLIKKTASINGSAKKKTIVKTEPKKIGKDKPKKKVTINKTKTKKKA
jgi:hypothetical protein